MADEPAAPDETRLDRLEAKVDQLLAGLHGKAEHHEEQHLDRPSTVEEQVRAELARAQAEQKAADDKTAADQAAASERETTAQRLAKLEEAKPVAPVATRTRVMWGKP